MGTILIIDVLVVGTLVALALTRGTEGALPFYAFVLTLMPLEAAIPVSGLFELTVQRLATLTMAGLCLFFSAGDVGREHPPAPLKYLILLVWGWSLLASMDSIVPATSLKGALSDVVDFYMLYYIFVKTITTKETPPRILRAMVVALAVCCVLGLLDTYSHWRVTTLFPARMHRFTPGENGLMPDDGRMRSTFPHPILLGNGLALGIPWALYLLTLARSALQRAWLCLGTLLMFWCIYKTMSRGPWLALGLSMLLLVLFGRAKIRRYVGVLALASVAVCVTRPGVWTTLSNTYHDTRDADSARGSSYQYRYDLMSQGAKALSKSLPRAIWGYGPQSFYYLHLSGVDPSTGHAESFESCDSALVESAVDTGYVGLILLLLLLLIPARVAWQAFTRLQPPANLLPLLLFISLSAFILMAFSVMNWGWGQQSYMIWVAMALAMSYPRLSRLEGRSAEAPRRHITDVAELEPAVAEV